MHFSTRGYEDEHRHETSHGGTTSVSCAAGTEPGPPICDKDIERNLKNDVKHRSPTGLALARMQKHKLGMLGLYLVAVMGIAVIIVPVIVPISPDETRPWIGTQRPLFEHPDCSVDNAFTVGQAAETTRRAKASDELVYHVQKQQRVTYRVTMRRGRIHTIQSGAVSTNRLDLTTSGLEAYELMADGNQGRVLPGVLIQKGEEPPDGLFPPGERVLILDLASRANASRITVGLTAGTVLFITEENPGSENPAAAIGSITVRGEAVTRVVALSNGKRRELTVRHWFGTDELGRDLFVRVFYGGRISLLVGIVATMVSLLIGLAYGATAGYAGGKVDRVMMGIVDILYAIPFLFLVILLMVTFGRNIVMLFIALGAVQWLTMARIVRGQILSLKEMEFVEAARIGGESAFSVVFRQLVPHTLGPVIVYTTLTVPVIIMGESFLAFIGLQVQYQGASLDSWGALINSGVQSLGQNGENVWLLFFPSLAMVLTLFGLNSLGDGLRDCFDPKRSSY